MPIADSWHHPRNLSTGRAAEASFDDEEERVVRRLPVPAIIALVLVGAVVVAGLVVAMLTGGGHSVRIDPTEAPTASQEDPSKLTVPPAAPTGLSGRVEGDSIVWTWTAPADSNYTSDQLMFQYRLERPGEAPPGRVRDAARDARRRQLFDGAHGRGVFGLAVPVDQRLRGGELSA